MLIHESIRINDSRGLSLNDQICRTDHTRRKLGIPATRVSDIPLLSVFRAPTGVPEGSIELADPRHAARQRDVRGWKGSQGVLLSRVGGESAPIEIKSKAAGLRFLGFSEGGVLITLTWQRLIIPDGCDRGPMTR